MTKIRFIHTADIHLGSYLRISKDYPTNIRKITETAIFEAFARVCKAAIEYGVDFMIISGDIYDREAEYAESVPFFIDQCRKLNEAGIPVYVIAGNHDPLERQANISEMPENLHILSGDVPEIYHVVGKQNRIIARVVGQSYQRKTERKKIHLDYTVSDTSVWNIGLLHTELDTEEGDIVPCLPGELNERKDIHYWALGHLHQCCILNRSFPIVVYPGIPQGRKFSEKGLCGCFLVELDPSLQPALSLIPTASVVWQRVEVYINEYLSDLYGNIPELEERISLKSSEILKSFPPLPSSLRLSENSQIGQILNYKGIKLFIIQWIIKGVRIPHDIPTEQKEKTAQILTENLRKKFKEYQPFIWTDSVVFEPHIWENMKQ